MRRNPRVTLDPNASPEALAAYWATLGKRQRLRLLRDTQAAAMPSSAARQAAVAREKAEAAKKV